MKPRMTDVVLPPTFEQTASFTPGPWFYTDGDVWVDTREQVCCGRGYNECCGEPDVHGGQELIAQTSSTNAPLIAAAPSLLSLLEELIDIEGPCPGTAEWATKARAAIAKAKAGA